MDGKWRCSKTFFLTNKKVKQEFIQEEEEDEPSEKNEDQMTVSQLYLSRQNSLRSPPLIKQTKPLEMKEKLFQQSRKWASVPSSNKSTKESFHGLRKSWSYKRKKALADHFYDSAEAKSLVMERAEEVQASLATELPSFVKSMFPTNVIRGFTVKLPSQFCHKYLPRQDATVILIGGTGYEYKINFLAERSSLSGGWIAFSKANELVVGDVLVFHLVSPLKFKVYVVRANNLPEVDGAIALLNLDTRPKQTGFWKNCLKHLPANIAQDSIPKNNQMLFNINLGAASGRSGNDSEDPISDTSEGIEFSVCAVDFKEVTSFQKFSILVNGWAIDSKLSKYLRISYYELCCSQKSFLHDHLLKNINGRLAAEIISETIKIADAIRACTLSTSQADYVNWDKTLKSFELLGMNVGFIRARLDRLVKFTSASKENVESKRCIEARLEQAYAKEKIRTLELNVLELKEIKSRLDAEMETLKVIAERRELVFREEVNAPW